MSSNIYNFQYKEAIDPPIASRKEILPLLRVVFARVSWSPFDIDAVMAEVLSGRFRLRTDGRYKRLIPSLVAILTPPLPLPFILLILLRIAAALADIPLFLFII